MSVNIKKEIGDLKNNKCGSFLIWYTFIGTCVKGKQSRNFNSKPSTSYTFLNRPPYTTSVN